MKKVLVDASRYLSPRVKRQPPNPFSQLVPLMRDPQNATLSQGVPPFEMFPLSEASFTLSDGTKVVLTQDDVLAAQRCGLLPMSDSNHANSSYTHIGTRHLLGDPFLAGAENTLMLFTDHRCRRNLRARRTVGTLP